MRNVCIALGALVLFALLVFSPLLRPGAVINSQDQNVAVNAQTQRAMPEAMVGMWRDDRLAGIGQVRNGCLSNCPLCVPVVVMVGGFLLVAWAGWRMRKRNGMSAEETVGLVVYVGVVLLPMGVGLLYAALGVTFQ